MHQAPVNQRVGPVHQLPVQQVAQAPTQMPVVQQQAASFSENEGYKYQLPL